MGKLWTVFCLVLFFVLFFLPVSSAIASHPREYGAYNSTRDEGVLNAIGVSDYYFLRWESRNYSVIDNDPSKLAEIIFEQETGDQKLMREGEEWMLAGNYSLKVISIDVGEKKARIQLLYNGTVLKDSVAGGAQSTFVYKRAIAGVENVPQFICYLHDVFHGIDASVLVIKYSFLISGQTIALPANISFLKTTPMPFAVYEATGRDAGIARALGGAEYYYLKWQSGEYAAVDDDPGKLALIIVNQSIDDEKILAAGEYWQLGGGYSLKVHSLDPGNKQAWLQLYRGDLMLKEEILGGSDPSDNLFVYLTSIGWTGSVPQFICYLEDVLRTVNESYAVIKYSFLISEETAAMLSVEIKIDPLEIATAQEANVRVNVTGEGEPVGGARIMLNISSGNLEESEGLTDRNGSFSTSFRASRSGNFTITATAEKAGYITTSSEASMMVTGTPVEIYILLALTFLVLIALILWLNQKLSLLAAPKEIPADGASSTRIVIEKVNYFNSPRPVKYDMEIELSTTAGWLPGTIVMPADTSKADAFLIAPREPGVAEVAVKAGDLRARTKVVFMAPELYLRLKARPVELPADGKSTSEITVRIVDRNGNLFSLDRERTVLLSTTLGTIGSPVKMAGGSAVANATLIAPLASGVAKVTVDVEDLRGSIEVVFR